MYWSKGWSTFTTTYLMLSDYWKLDYLSLHKMQNYSLRKTKIQVVVEILWLIWRIIPMMRTLIWLGLFLYLQSILRIVSSLPLVLFKVLKLVTKYMKDLGYKFTGHQILGLEEKLSLAKKFWKKPTVHINLCCTNVIGFLRSVNCLAFPLYLSPKGSPPSWPNQFPPSLSFCPFITCVTWWDGQIVTTGLCTFVLS